MVFVLLFLTRFTQCDHLVFSHEVVSDSFATLWTVAYQAPLPIGFPGRNTEVGCHFLLQGIFLTQGSQFLTTEPPGKPCDHLLFSHSVVSGFVQPHGRQHSRPPRPSPTPGARSNSCPLSR